MNAANQSHKEVSAREFLKPFNKFLDIPGATEVAVNKPGQVFVKTFAGWQQHQAPELTYSHLDSLALSLTVLNGIQKKSLNSLILPDGQRGQINLPPALMDGYLSYNIRIASSVVKSLEQLAVEGVFSNVRDVSFNKPTEDEAQRLLTETSFKRLEPHEVELLHLKREGRWVEFLELAVLSLQNMIIAGGTGSGKTTFGRSLIEKVPVTERIVTIEDVRELILPNHPNLVPMLFGEGPGRVTPKECLRAAMRMTPDRIFPAELRGDEAWEYLMSLNTGHPGSLTTIHANSGIETFGRLFALIKSSDVGRELDSSFIKDEIYKTVHMTLFFKKWKLVEVFYDPIFSKSKLE